MRALALLPVHLPHRGEFRAIRVRVIVLAQIDVPDAVRLGHARRLVRAALLPSTLDLRRAVEERVALAPRWIAGQTNGIARRARGGRLQRAAVDHSAFKDAGLNSLARFGL